MAASIGCGKRRSIHAEICMIGMGLDVWNTSRLTIRCIQVMVTMLTGAGCQTVVHTMSPPESLKAVPPVTVQRAEPLWLSGIMRLMTSVSDRSVSVSS